MFWLLYFASPFVAANLAGELEVLGQGVAKATDRLVDTSVVSPGQIWVVFIGRALTFSIGLAALLGGLRRLLAGCRDGPAIVLAISPIPMLANSYGGEILFRVYLFALPFLAYPGMVIEIDVFEDVKGKNTDKPAFSVRGLPPSKEQDARKSYQGLRSAVLKSAQLKSVVKQDATTGRMSRELIVEAEETEAGGELERRDMENPRIVAHLPIRVEPNDDYKKD